MQNVAITELELVNFRIHKHFKYSVTEKNIGITGNNGSGKTSILEAISLLSPGRGMLSAKNQELVYNPETAGIRNDSSAVDDDKVPTLIEADNYVNAFLSNGVRISLHNKYVSSGKYEKILKINDKISPSQSSLLQWCDVLWFTSQMQYDFLLSSLNRRKFVDRMTYHILPDHALHLKELEKLNRERMKVMHMHDIDHKWIDILEKQLAICNWHIVQNRIKVVNNINSFSAQNRSLPFPAFTLTIEGLEEELAAYNEDEAKSYLIEELYNSRRDDIASSRTSLGAHRSDFKLHNVAKNNYLEYNSSGEQKTLLISLIASFAKMVGNERQRFPIILFDELISFLDQKNIDNVIEAFSAMTGQIWLASAVSSDYFNKYSMQIINLS